MDPSLMETVIMIAGMAALAVITALLAVATAVAIMEIGRRIRRAFRRRAERKRLERFRREGVAVLPRATARKLVAQRIELKRKLVNRSRTQQEQPR